MPQVTEPFRCCDVFRCSAAHRSSHHAFSRFTSSSSSGVKSFLMLNLMRISSGVLPLISSATVLQVKSSKGLMSR